MPFRELLVRFGASLTGTESGSSICEECHTGPGAAALELRLDKDSPSLKMGNGSRIPQDQKILLVLIVSLAAASSIQQEKPAGVDQNAHEVQNMTLVLDGHSLKIEDVVEVARNREQIKVHEDAIARIQKCRGLLERKIEAREIM